MSRTETARCLLIKQHDRRRNALRHLIFTMALAFDGTIPETFPAGGDA
jgi:hypothetical protein